MTTVNGAPYTCLQGGVIFKKFKIIQPQGQSRRPGGTGWAEADDSNVIACPTHCTGTASTAPPGDRAALHCHWIAIATQQLGRVPFSPRGPLI